MADRMPTSTDGEVKKRQLSDYSQRSGENLTTPASPPSRVRGVLTLVAAELKTHAPFTMLGTVTGIIIMAALTVVDMPRTVSVSLFWCMHPAHVLLSALVTTAMFTLHSRRTWLGIVVVGYVGSVGIATLSDCIIPYVGESFLDLPHRGIHLGFIEKWWLVNPLAAAGILLGYLWPRTRLAHAGHVLLSTWASLFHITMAMGSQFSILGYAVVTVFLFLAVWIPCCTSDIVFPLLFTTRRRTVDDSNSQSTERPLGPNVSIRCICSLEMGTECQPLICPIP